MLLLVIQPGQASELDARSPGIPSTKWCRIALLLSSRAHCSSKAWTHAETTQEMKVLSIRSWPTMEWSPKSMGTCSPPLHTVHLWSGECCHLLTTWLGTAHLGLLCWSYSNKTSHPPYPLMLIFIFSRFQKQRFGIFLAAVSQWLGHKTCWGSAFSHARPTHVFHGFCLVACGLSSLTLRKGLPCLRQPFFLFLVGSKSNVSAFFWLRFRMAWALFLCF